MSILPLVAGVGVLMLMLVLMAAVFHVMAYAEGQMQGADRFTELLSTAEPAASVRNRTDG